MNKAIRRPNAFVMASTNHGLMMLNRHDYRYTENGAYGVGFQLLNSSCYDPEEVANILGILDTRHHNFGDGVVAIDCGANLGVHTIEWAQYMHNWGSVVAIEAQERVFYALAGNITINNCFNARAIWAAVGGESGEIRVPVPDYFIPSSFGSLEIRKTESTEFIGQKIDYSEAGTQLVKKIAIDDMGLDRVDFIKIDIEGMEMDALKGAEKVINKFRPIMFVEKIKSNEVELVNILRLHGYAIHYFGINLLAIHESDPANSQIVF